MQVVHIIKQEDDLCMVDWIEKGGEVVTCWQRESQSITQQL
jgi:hypothetical protein